MSGSAAFRPPNAFEAFFSKLLGRLVAHGVGPGHMRVLEVRGRRSGRPMATPVDPIEMDGVTYLVAPRGQTQWVQNARAAGRVALRRGAAAWTYAVTELAVAERAPVLKAYLNAYPVEVKRYFPVDGEADLESFAEIAERYPVFRLEAET
jgi:deazaflavin-dependent oxidoreductase (nitroreductase family)